MFALHTMFLSPSRPEGVALHLRSDRLLKADSAIIISNNLKMSCDAIKKHNYMWTISKLPKKQVWNRWTLSKGQHSLTSVERPSYLRSDFVNVWRQAQVKYVIHLHFDRLYPTCLIFGERFCPTFLIIPRLIPIYSNKKMPMPSFKGCFDVSSLFLLRGEKDLSVDVTE